MRSPRYFIPVILLAVSGCVVAGPPPQRQTIVERERPVVVNRTVVERQTVVERPQVVERNTVVVRP
jgi:hypothetical protein